MFNFFKKESSAIQEKTIQQEDFTNVSSIAEYFHSHTGITFDKQMTILTSKVSSFCKQRDIYSFDELLKKIKSDTKIEQEIIDHLTTNETYFYREIKQIKELVQLVQQSASPVNILCAPSSTGEEPYSIAIALLEAGVSTSKFSVLGIDINSEAIEKAKGAIYGQRNVRNLSSEIIAKYFKEDDSQFILNPSVKSLVDFKVTNLFDASFNSIGTFDFVFSRNMLIYFDKETKLKAKNILESVRKNDTHDVFFGHADLF